MRTLTEALLTAQASNNRYPISKIEIYDTLLRWSLATGSFASDVSDAFPETAAMDADIDSETGMATVAWRETLDGDICYRYGTDVVSWLNFTEDGYDATPWATRPDVFGRYVFFGLWDSGGAGGSIVRWDSVGEAFEYFGSEFIYLHAVAAVASDELYTCRLWDGGDSGNKLIFEHVAGTTVTECLTKYSVSDDYEHISGDFDISWFDAVRLDDGTDVILFNSDHDGNSKIILRRNGVWGDARDIIPTDLVDNYTFLRIGWLKVYNGVIYATGELGRSGSTGLHPQSMGVVLRSKDGVHWSLDRFRYMGELPCRTPLVMYGGYAYRFSVPNIYVAPLTPVFGLDDADITEDHVKITVTDDIVEWTTDLSEGGSQFRARISNYGLQYSDPASASYLKPGYMAKLYAGYRNGIGIKDHLVLIGTYGIDTFPRTVAASDNVLYMSGRDISMKMIGDYAFDQDWSWLSQVKHYDPCETAKKMYGIDGTLSVVTKDTIYKMLGGLPLWNFEGGRLMSYAKNKRNVYISTSPYEATDAHIALGFNLTDEVAWSQPGLYDIGKNFSETDHILGNGAGPAFIKDKYNFLTAFVDCFSEQAILLRVEGSTVSDEVWTVLASASVSDMMAEDDDILYEPYMNLVGNRLRWGVNKFQVGYPGLKPTSVHFEDAVDVPRYDEYRVGCVTAGYVPTINVTVRNLTYSEDARFAARHLADFNDGLEMGSDATYPETSMFTWAEFMSIIPAHTNDIIIGNEGMRISATQSVRGDFCTGQWEILDVEQSLYDEDSYNITVDDTKYPAGEDPHWWHVNAENFAMHFVDGECEGMFGRVYNATDLGGTIEFSINLPTVSSTPVVGDHVVVGPGFEVSRETPYGYTPGMPAYRYGWEALGVRLFSFSAFDTKRDNTLDYLLKDIASKAGVLDFAGGTSEYPDDTGLGIDYVFYAHEDETHLITTKLMGNVLIVIDLIEDLTFADDGITTIIFGTDTYWEVPEFLPASKVTITGDGGDYTVDFYYRASTTPTGVWRLMKRQIVDIEGGKRLTVSKVGNSICLWLEDKMLAACTFRSLGIEYEYNEAEVAMKSGLLLLNVLSGLTAYTVQQPELHTIIDGIYVNQGANTQSGFSTAIKDMRVKMLPTSAGVLRISSFVDHEDAGEIPDVVYTDSISNTDRIPTHVRVTGAEISEYIDHAAAAEYGVSFFGANTPNLYEEEAYQEAQRIVDDAISFAGGRQIAIGAQLQYEPEDRVALSYESVNGEIIDEDCVITSVSIDFGEAKLESRLVLRRYYEETSSV